MQRRDIYIGEISAKGKWTCRNGDHPFSPFLSSEFPQVKFSPREVHFPHLHFHQNHQFSFSANFRQTQKLNNSSKFYYYKKKFLRVHWSNFRNGENWLFVGVIRLVAISFRKWGKRVITCRNWFQLRGTCMLSDEVDFQVGLF